jgi:hypothetical protein
MLGEPVRERADRHRRLAKGAHDRLDQPPVVLRVEGQPKVGQVWLQRQTKHREVARVSIYIGRDVRGPSFD